MASQFSLADAIQRLERAVAALDDAVEHRGERQKRQDDAEAELHKLSADRSRLAHALDTAEARGAYLEETNREVSRRLIGALETIRAVVARHEADPVR